MVDTPKTKINLKASVKTFLFQIYNLLFLDIGSLIANIQTHIIFYFAFESFQIDKLAENHCFQKTYSEKKKKKTKQTNKQQQQQNQRHYVQRERNNYKPVDLDMGSDESDGTMRQSYLKLYFGEQGIF